MARQDDAALQIVRAQHGDPSVGLPHPQEELAAKALGSAARSCGPQRRGRPHRLDEGEARGVRLELHAVRDAVSAEWREAVSAELSELRTEQERGAESLGYKSRSSTHPAHTHSARAVFPI